MRLLILNLGAYLFLLNFISLVLNDALDSDQVVIVDECLLTVLLFLFLLFLTFSHVLAICITFDFLFAILVGRGGFLLLRRVLLLSGCRF